MAQKLASKQFYSDDEDLLEPDLSSSDSEQLEDTPLCTSKDLTPKRYYKLLDIQILADVYSGKKAIGVFEDQSRPEHKITVVLPKAVSNLPHEVIELMQKNIAMNRHPRYVVHKVTSRAVDFEWR